MKNRCGADWSINRNEAMTASAGGKRAQMKIVKLVGMDALSPDDRLKMEAAQIDPRGLFAAERLP